MSRISRELKQNKAVQEPTEEAIQHSRNAALLDTRSSASSTTPITGTQYNVLRILRGSEPDGLCRNEIGARLVRQVPDVTRLLDRLEDARLISRQRGGDDRRYVTTRITKAGLKLLDQMDTRINETQTSISATSTMVIFQSVTLRPLFATGPEIDFF